MKSKEEIKQALHQLIDTLEDEDLLQQLMGDVVPYVIENRRRHPAPPEKEKHKDVNKDDIDWDAYKIDPDDPGAKN